MFHEHRDLPSSNLFPGDDGSGKFHLLCSGRNICFHPILFRGLIAILLLVTALKAYQVTVTAIGTTTFLSTTSLDPMQSCTVTSLAYPIEVSLNTALPGYIEFIYAKCDFLPSIEVSLPCGAIALAPGEAFSTTCYSDNITYLVKASRGLPAPALLVLLLSLKSPPKRLPSGQSDGKILTDVGRGPRKRHRGKTPKTCGDIWKRPREGGRERKESFTSLR